jgi:hypothetical protein
VKSVKNRKRGEGEECEKSREDMNYGREYEEIKNM